jgi:hypothetical protein
MVGNIVDVGWATIKSGCLPITGEMIHEKTPKSKILCQTPFTVSKKWSVFLPMYSTIGRQQSELSTESPKPKD